MNSRTPASYAVIIPSFNAESTIAETLSSVLGQSIAPAAVFIVDDNSTDHTLEVVRGLNSGLVRTHVLDKNSGSAAAPRNTGIQLCDNQFEYIAFCDADDIWMRDKIELQLCSMAACNSQFSFGDVVRFRGTPPISASRSHPPLSLKVSLRDFRFDNIVKSGSSVLVHRSASHLLHFPEGRQYRGIEDYYAWLGVVSTQGVSSIHIQAPLIYYRQSGVSVSASKLYMHRLRKDTYDFKKALFLNNGISLPSFYTSELLYITKQVRARLPELLT